MNKRVIRTEYVVMLRSVSETQHGAISESAWEYVGSAPTVEQCYGDVIEDRVRLRRRDPENPHLHAYDQGAIFQMRIHADGGWHRGRLIENF